MKKRIITLLLITVITFSVTSISIFRINYFQKKPSTEKTKDRVLAKPYGYEQLDEFQQKLYDFMSLRNFKNDEEYYFEKKYDYDYINIVTELYNTNNYELCAEFCYRTIMEDYPEDKNKPVQSIGIAATNSFVPPSEEDAHKKKILVENKINEIIENIPNNLTELEEIQYLYDYVINNITYDKENLVEDNGSAYGGLIIGKAICQGYAHSFEMIARAAGFKVIMVHGTVGMYEASHAWNMIEYKGNWYYLDATWDDDNLDFYSYFMLSDEEHSNKRINNINDYSYKIPVPKSQIPLSKEERNSIIRSKDRWK